MGKLVVISILLFLSCGEKAKDTIELLPESKTEIQTKQIVETIACDAENRIQPKSLLICKIKDLETLKHNYLLKDFNQNIGLEDTKIYRGVQFSSESVHYGNANVEAIFKKINFLNNFVEEVNQCNIKGTYAVGENTYPRASITEVVFSSESCAMEFMTTIETVKQEGSLMARINKSPNSIFRENNIIYYVSSGGFYMWEYYGEIETQMKMQTCS